MSREGHITYDGRTGLFDPQPLRTFKVYRIAGSQAVDPVEVQAHMANQLESGALAFMTMKGGLAFTTRAFAAGQWSNFEGSLPTEDEVRTIKTFAEREQAITAMLAHDQNSTRQ